MVKEKRILSYFIGWLILGFIVCFVGVNKIFALQNNNGIWFYDNLGTSVTEVETTYTEAIDISEAIFSTTANSYGGLVVIQLDKPLIKDHIYTLFLNVGAESNGGSTMLSTKNCLGASNSKNGSVNEYLNCSITPKYSQYVGVTTDKGRGIYYTFISNTNGAYLAIPYTTEFTCTKCLQYSYGYNINDAGDSNNLSQEEVNTIINNQTTIIQNDITNMQESISNDLDDMESAIVDSNKETQEVIKDQFNTCRDSVNLLNLGTLIKGYVDLSNGILITQNNSYSYYFKTSDLPNTITISSKNGNRSNITYWNTLPTIGGQANIYGYPIYDSNIRTLEINKNYEYILIQFSYNLIPEEIQVQSGSVATEYEKPGEKVCTNKIDDTNDKLDNLTGAITDSSSPNTGALENSAGWLPAGPLDSILNLPLTMLNSLTNSLGKTCSPLNLTLPYVNKNIQIPCLSTIFAQITGVNGLWTWVGTIASVLILYNYLLNLYAWVDKVLTLRAEFDEAMGADLANWGRL